jgi:hypothetical protein
MSARSEENVPDTPRNTVTRDDVRRILGDVDDLMVAEIVSAGLSIDDLFERAREYERDAWDDDDEYRD